MSEGVEEEEEKNEREVRCKQGGRDEGLTNGQRKVGRTEENSSGMDGGGEAEVEDRMDR